MNLFSRKTNLICNSLRCVWTMLRKVVDILMLCERIMIEQSSYIGQNSIYRLYAYAMKWLKMLRTKICTKYTWDFELLGQLLQFWWIQLLLLKTGWWQFPIIYHQWTSDCSCSAYFYQHIRKVAKLYLRNLVACNNQSQIQKQMKEIVYSSLLVLLYNL